MEKCKQYKALPMVSIGLELPNIPSVLIDNENGIYTAVNHLIDVHHYSRIGFLNGPLHHPEAQLRFQAYAKAMQEHNLPLNQNLILQCDFQLESATAVIKEFIETRQQIPGRDIDALVCANDYMAAGANMEFLEHGYRIPEDIALVGFDDIIYAKYLIPPLSTVNNPIEKMSTKAFALLMDLMAGKQVPQTTSMATTFIPRCSCGCQQQIIPENELKILQQSDYNFSIKNINQQVSTTTIPQIRIWQNALTFMQNYQSKRYESNNSNNLAISVIGNTVENYLKHTAIEMEMHYVGIYLNSTLDLTKLLEILLKRLPIIGIRRFYLNLYEDAAEYNVPGKLPPWSNMILAYNEQAGQIVKEELPPEGLRFPTCELIPQAMQTKYGQQDWIMMALHFDQEQIGFIMLDTRMVDDNFYFIVRLQISSCLKGALLLKGYQAHSAELAEANKRIQEFNKQLKDENLRIKMEMDVARSIQVALLPQDVSHIHPDFEIASLMIPATEVGGDYFDITLDEQQNLWLGIGDVSGHGLKAGLIMLIAQSAQTAIMSSYNVTPRDVIITMNKVLFRSVTNRMRQNQYMTCAILKYLNQGRFQFAGMHLNFLIYREKTQTCEEVILDGLWLNILENLDDLTPNSEFVLELRDVLVLYTDGITEAANHNSILLDIEGLKKIIIRHGDKNINDMLEAIKDDVAAWNAGIDKDDITLVIIRRIQ